jgi:hypothetical protein
MARELSGQQHFHLVDIKRLTKIARRKLSGQRAAKAFNDFISLRLVRHMIGQAAASPQVTPPTPKPQFLTPKVDQPRKWSGGSALSEIAMRNLMQGEGLKPRLHFSRGGSHYAIHFSTTQVIWVVSGGMSLSWADDQTPVPLQPGDRLDLPSGRLYHFYIEKAGAVYLQAKSAPAR